MERGTKINSNPKGQVRTGLVSHVRHRSVAKVQLNTRNLNYTTSLCVVSCTYSL